MTYEEDNVFFSESLTDFTPRKLVDYIAMVLIKKHFLTR